MAGFRILLNREETKLELYSRAAGVRFASLDVGETSEGDVALVVEGQTFEHDLERAISLGIPVVVIAGSGDVAHAAAAAATAVGVPPQCILVKRGNRVETYNGESIGPASARGIGLKVVVDAARRALEERLLPELLIWEEKSVAGESGYNALEDTHREQEVSAGGSGSAVPPAKVGRPEAASGTYSPGPGTASRNLEGMLSLFGMVAAVFRSVPEADSSLVASQLASRLGAPHLEVSPEPRSYGLYGRTLKDACASGRYAHCDGRNVSPVTLLGGAWIVVEVDPLTPEPEAVEAVYRHASLVVHALSSARAEESVRAVQLWIDSGWKLDAVVPDDSRGNAVFSKSFGSLFCETVEKVPLHTNRGK